MYTNSIWPIDGTLSGATTWGQNGPGSDVVTLCGWHAWQTIPLSILARNPNKGLELEIFDETRSGGGKKGPKEDRGSVGEGRRREAVDNGQQKRPVRYQSRGRTVSRRRQRGKTVKGELAFLVAFVEVSQKYTSTIVYKFEKSCTKSSQNFLSCAWNWPKSILFVCSSPILLVAFFVAVKKCKIPWQNPLDQWFSNFFLPPPPDQIACAPLFQRTLDDGNVKCHKNWLILQSQTVWRI